MMFSMAFSIQASIEFRWLFVFVLAEMSAFRVVLASNSVNCLVYILVSNKLGCC